MTSLNVFPDAIDSMTPAFHPLDNAFDPSVPQPRSGYTLPVFACAAAIAALRQLNAITATSDSGVASEADAGTDKKADAMISLHTVPVFLINPDHTVEIEIEHYAPLDENRALAITRSDPGDNLDLTRHTPVWAMVTRRPFDASRERIRIIGGEGIGKQMQTGHAAIYHYAQALMRENLTPLLMPNQAIEVSVILPEGRSLATRTSNAAFGVIDGLSLLGTSGIAQPLSAPGQFQTFRETVRKQSQQTQTLVFCIGENGLDLARKLGIREEHLIKTANWIGPLLVEAGECGVQSILLFGYHGKLIKLAGGIFHTHHYLADGRHEIFSAACVQAGLPIEQIQRILGTSTLEDALTDLRKTDQLSGSHWVESVYSHLVETIERRSHDYIYTHSQKRVNIGTLMFDRHRNIIQTSPTGSLILRQVC